MNKITVATFEEKPPAEAVRQRLEQAGVHAEVYDESKLQRFWYLSHPHASQKLRVDEDDFDRAREILEGLDAREHVLDQAVRCPQCNSSRVEYPQFTRKFITTTLVEIFTLLRGAQKEFYCQDCQYTWPVEIPPEPELDILNWPVRKQADDDDRAKKG